MRTRLSLCSLVAVTLAGCSVLLSPGAGLAADPGIVVSGTGTASAKPDIVEMGGVVVGQGELASDAIIKFRGNKRRAIEAIESLGIKGLTVKGTGVTVNSGDGQSTQVAMMMGQVPDTGVAAQVTFSESLIIALEGAGQTETEELLETIIKIIDAAKDAGLAIGPKPMSMLEVQLGGGGATSALATFRVTNVDRPEQEAYRAAMADARANAQRLAELSGVRLGAVISIQEGPAPAENENYQAMIMRSIVGGVSSAKKEYSSTKFEEIPVTVILQVQFEIGAE